MKEKSRGIEQDCRSVYIGAVLYSAGFCLLQGCFHCEMRSEGALSWKKGRHHYLTHLERNNMSRRELYDVKVH